jgi:dethiobiotin synthase
MRGVFVTGTDTGVGKTVTSAVLAASRGWGYWKPVQTGPESDTAEVARLAGCRVWDRGVRLPDPVSPHLAARRVGQTIALEDVVAQAPFTGEWVVEGAGGVLVPVNDREKMIDLMLLLNLPVVVAARSTLGTINHTLMTLETLRRTGLSVEKVVMVGDPNADNQEAIEFYGQVPVSVLPFLRPLTPERVRGQSL